MTRRPTVVLVDRDGRTHDVGSVSDWWRSDVVFHAVRYGGFVGGAATCCGQRGHRLAARIPLRVLVQVARPCKTCWREAGR